MVDPGELDRWGFGRREPLSRLGKFLNPMHSFRAVIFDMDGVIVDSEPLHARAFERVFEEIGFGQTHGVDFPSYFGKSDLVLWKDFVGRHRPKQPLEVLMEWKQARFDVLLRTEQPVFDGVLELLAVLQPRYDLALASGSRHVTIRGVLELRNLRSFFPVAVSSEDVEHGKPAPDIFLRTAELLRRKPSECCVIEDSEAGVEAALSAGMKVIGITNSLPATRLRRATWVMKDYAEIGRFLLG